jgi:predicted metal-binding protein
MTNAIVSRSTPWKRIVLVCGKCTRKLDGGFGPDGDEALRSILRQALKESGHRRDVRVIATKCMGLCPKNAVTMVDAGRPETMYAIPAGTRAADVLARVSGTVTELNRTQLDEPQ